MTHVNTVTGAIDVGRLGRTLVHEHFVFGYPGFAGDITLGAQDRHEIVHTCVAVAERVRQHGVRSVIDVTPNDCGRDPELLREISERSGVQIICATGYYYEGEGAPAYFKFRSPFVDVQQEIFEMFMHEITAGIGQTGIRAGVIKVASGKGAISDYERVFFKAAARAQRETGVPIITHTQEGTMGPEQAQLLIAEGADPRKILIGHMDGSTDVTCQLRTLATGVSIGFDRYGLQHLGGMPADEARHALVIGLVGLGFEKQIMLSHDTVGVWLGRPVPLPAPVLQLVKDWHAGHICENVIPALGRGGVTASQIETILVQNPARLFTGE